MCLKFCSQTTERPLILKFKVSTLLIFCFANLFEHYNYTFYTFGNVRLHFEQLVFSRSTRLL